MSITHTYTATPRTAFGGTAAKALRAQNLVPVTISRPGKPSLQVSLDQKTAEKFHAEVVHLAKVTIGSDTVTVLKGAVERHPLKDIILHVDLIEVDEKSEIKVDVAVAPDARNCPGVKAGGIVEQRLRKVKVKCLAGAIPDSISLDLGDVQIMQTVYAKSLTMPANVKLLTNPRLPVLSVVITRGMKKVDDAAAAAAPAAAAAKPAAGAAPAAAAAKPAAKK
jgi:large subunit ribosomal protein L25